MFAIVHGLTCVNGLYWSSPYVAVGACPDD